MQAAFLKGLNFTHLYPDGATFRITEKSEITCPARDRITSFELDKQCLRGWWIVNDKEGHRHWWWSTWTLSHELKFQLLDHHCYHVERPLLPILHGSTSEHGWSLQRLCFTLRRRRCILNQRRRSFLLWWWRNGDYNRLGHYHLLLERMPRHKLHYQTPLLTQRRTTIPAKPPPKHINVVAGPSKHPHPLALLSVSPTSKVLLMQTTMHKPKTPSSLSMCHQLLVMSTLARKIPPPAAPPLLDTQLAPSAK